jgi:hypothetical protein
MLSYIRQRNCYTQLLHHPKYEHALPSLELPNVPTQLSRLQARKNYCMKSIKCHVVPLPYNSVVCLPGEQNIQLQEILT